MKLTHCRFNPKAFLALAVVFGSFVAPMVASAKDKLPRKVKSEMAYLVQVEPDVPVVRAPKQANLLAVAEAQSPMRVFRSYGREGIDVSRYQGRIDWQAVAKENNIAYAYIKATEGASLVDPTFRYNLTEARRAGIKVGSYHFYRAHISIEEQLRNLTANVKAHEHDLLPMIDVEVTNGVAQEKFVEDLRVFVDAVTKHYGRKPVMYTFQNFYNKHFLGERFKDYVWMIAKYHKDEPVLRDNLNYAMWQYTASGRVIGVKGDVDRSRIMSGYSLADFSF